jgi:hypothetical protein
MYYANWTVCYLLLFLLDIINFYTFLNLRYFVIYDISLELLRYLVYIEQTDSMPRLET